MLDLELNTIHDLPTKFQKKYTLISRKNDFIQYIKKKDGTRNWLWMKTHNGKIQWKYKDLSSDGNVQACFFDDRFVYGLVWKDNFFTIRKFDLLDEKIYISKVDHHIKEIGTCKFVVKNDLIIILNVKEYVIEYYFGVIDGSLRFGSIDLKRLKLDGFSDANVHVSICDKHLEFGTHASITIVGVTQPIRTGRCSTRIGKEKSSFLPFYNCFNENKKFRKRKSFQVYNCIVNYENIQEMMWNYPLPFTNQKKDLNFQIRWDSQGFICAILVMLEGDDTLLIRLNRKGKALLNNIPLNVKETIWFDRDNCLVFFSECGKISSCKRFDTTLTSHNFGRDNRSQFYSLIDTNDRLVVSNGVKEHHYTVVSENYAVSERKIESMNLEELLMLWHETFGSRFRFHDIQFIKTLSSKIAHKICEGNLVRKMVIRFQGIMKYLSIFLHPHHTPKFKYGIHELGSSLTYLCLSRSLEGTIAIYFLSQLSKFTSVQVFQSSFGKIAKGYQDQLPISLMSKFLLENSSSNLSNMLHIVQLKDSKHFHDVIIRSILSGKKEDFDKSKTLQMKSIRDEFVQALKSYDFKFALNLVLKCLTSQKIVFTPQIGLEFCNEKTLDVEITFALATLLTNYFFEETLFCINSFASEKTLPIIVPLVPKGLPVNVVNRIYQTVPNQHYVPIHRDSIGNRIVSVCKPYPVRSGKVLAVRLWILLGEYEMALACCLRFRLWDQIVQMSKIVKGKLRDDVVVELFLKSFLPTDLSNIKLDKMLSFATLLGIEPKLNLKLINFFLKRLRESFHNQKDILHITSIPQSDFGQFFTDLESKNPFSMLKQVQKVFSDQEALAIHTKSPDLCPDHIRHFFRYIWYLYLKFKFNRILNEDPSQLVYICIKFLPFSDILEEISIHGLILSSLFYCNDVSLSTDVILKTFHSYDDIEPSLRYKLEKILNKISSMDPSLHEKIQVQLRSPNPEQSIDSHDIWSFQSDDDYWKFLAEFVENQKFPEIYSSPTSEIQDSLMESNASIDRGTIAGDGSVGELNISIEKDELSFQTLHLSPKSLATDFIVQRLCGGEERSLSPKLFKLRIANSVSIKNKYRKRRNVELKDGPRILNYQAPLPEGNIVFFRPPGMILRRNQDKSNFRPVSLKKSTQEYQRHHERFTPKREYERNIKREGQLLDKESRKKNEMILDKENRKKKNEMILKGQKVIVGEKDRTKKFLPKSPPSLRKESASKTLSKTQALKVSRSIQAFPHEVSNEPEDELQFVVHQYPENNNDKIPRIQVHQYPENSSDKTPRIRDVNSSPISNQAGKSILQLHPEIGKHLSEDQKALLSQFQPIKRDSSSTKSYLDEFDEQNSSASSIQQEKPFLNPTMIQNEDGRITFSMETEDRYREHLRNFGMDLKLRESIYQTKFGKYAVAPINEERRIRIEEPQNATEFQTPTKIPSHHDLLLRTKLQKLIQSNPHFSPQRLEGKDELLHSPHRSVSYKIHPEIEAILEKGNELLKQFDDIEF